MHSFFRYSHSAHVINGKLVVVGGVWLQADGVPGVAIINLINGVSVEVQLDTVSHSAHELYQVSTINGLLQNGLCIPINLFQHGTFEV